jgi:threonine/homoserine/homoserine lactone efflux protein
MLRENGSSLLGRETSAVEEKSPERERARGCLMWEALHQAFCLQYLNVNTFLMYLGEIIWIFVPKKNIKYKMIIFIIVL